MNTTARGLAMAALVVIAGAAVALAEEIVPGDSGRLDTPALNVVRAGFFRIDLNVEAGQSGAPAGFEIQWMSRADYDRLGGWPADPHDPAISIYSFKGSPTLNPDEGSPTFKLGPGVSIDVQMGDVFDETGVAASDTGVLDSNTDYVFRVHALSAPNIAESLPSGSVDGGTTRSECTQGFWKTHPESWPSGCTPMLLGTVSYTQAELLSIYNTPARGNGLLSLAHQLITTKLNGCNGSNLVPVAADIAAADALIGSLVVPPLGSGYLAPSTTSALTQTLDDYNNGFVTGVISCTVPQSSLTWGSMKAQYQ